MPAENKQPSFLEFLPVSFFGATMGLCGLAFCWEFAEKAWGAPGWIKEVIGGIAVLLFIWLLVAYIVKIIKYGQLVRAELKHPVAVSFFGTFFISLLLLPGILLRYSQPLAIGVWTVGALGMAIFSWAVFRKWLSSQQNPADAAPAWVIPIVGTLDVPVIGLKLPLPGIHEVCLLYFAIGLVFGLILTTIILYRLLFQPALPEALQPTLMILIGPFALATSVYHSLTGAHDLVMAVFFYFDVALLLLFGSKVMLLPYCCPFRVSWWSVSFPLVAVTIAAFRYASQGPALVQFMPATLLTLSTLVIGYLLIQTFYKLFRHTLLLPNPVAEKATRTLEPAVKPI